MTGPEDRDDDTALAAEYVLHLLDAEERADFESRLRSEAALRDLVRDWEARLAPLAEEVAPVAPPARLKRRLERRLFGGFEDPSRQGRLGRWLAAALVAGGVAASAVLVLPVVAPQVLYDPALSAQIAAEDRSLIVSASFIEQTGTLQVTRQAGTARPGRVLELWLIAEGASAPVSLGVLPEDARTRIDLPSDLAGRLSGGVLAISDEPPGGSPTGAPTGDVLAVGPVSDA